MKGYDASAHVLACFGGAGGQHACAIATALGMKTIFIHRWVRSFNDWVVHGVTIHVRAEDAAKPLLIISSAHTDADIVDVLVSISWGQQAANIIETVKASAKDVSSNMLLAPTHTRAHKWFHKRGCEALLGSWSLLCSMCFLCAGMLVCCLQSASSLLTLCRKPRSQQQLSSRLVNFQAYKHVWSA
eukprot:GHRR01034811.1.p1 GENE.GHRR01034811.1~~GHRR01034811.1.p1  ORF type:complete len:186 (-),score=43.44 GHRR01034811.1:261-818(-)